MGESKVGWAWVGVRRDKVMTFFGDKQEVDRKTHTYEALSRKALRRRLMGSLRVNDDGILHDSCTEALSRIYRHRERNKSCML